jgi:hypothetical protein
MTTTTTTTNTATAAQNLDNFWAVSDGAAVSFFLSEEKANAQSKLWAAQDPAYFPAGSTSKSEWNRARVSSLELVKWGSLATQRPQATYRPRWSNIMSISDANADYNEEVERNFI